MCATNEGLFGKVFEHDHNTFKFEGVGSDGTVRDGALGRNSRSPVRLSTQCSVSPFSHSTCLQPVDFEAPLDANRFRLLAKEGGYLSYIFGTIAAILESTFFADRVPNPQHVPGLHLKNYSTTLPMKKGLSSSAAICVFVAKTFDLHYRLQISQADLMEIAFQGEMMTPSRCGRMDQCVAMGAGCIALMQFTHHTCTMEVLTCPAPLHFVVVDLKAGKNTIRILQDLNACFPFPREPAHAGMHQYVQEIRIIAEQAKRSIEEGSAEKLAACMQAAQECFDKHAVPNCPSELTAPCLHKLLQDPVLRECTLAMKGVGSQGDGSAQLLCRDAQQQAEALRYVRDELHLDGFLLTLPAAKT